MRILFIQTNTYELLFPLPVGAAMVARRLQRDGHEVRFLDLMREKDPVGKVLSAAAEVRPDLACYSIRNRDNQSSGKYLDPIPAIRAVVSAAREKSGAPVLLGGTAFTTFPKRVLTLLEGDFGIAGDDLEAMSRFVRSLAAGAPDLSTPGLVYRANGGEIVENPFKIVGYRGMETDHHALIDLQRYRKGYWQGAVVTKTGCPERCAFCDTFYTFGRDYILREPGEIAEELLALKRSGKVRSVWLIDADFNRPLDAAKEVLREIIRRGAQLQICTVIDPGPTDAEFFWLFKRAGGWWVTLFADSLSDPVLRELDKSFKVADVMRASQEMRSEGIGFIFMPTFGGPGETPDTVRETLSRIPELAPTFCDFGIGWRIQPRTPLHERAVREGVMDADDDCWDAKFYISRDTPREWLEKETRKYKRRQPLRMWPMVRFMIASRRIRPWTWGPEDPSRNPGA